MEQIDSIFIKKASDVIGETSTGLSTSEIIETCESFAYNYNVKIPHSKMPLENVPNKRTALRENLNAFNGNQQFEILNHMCELNKLKDLLSVKEVKILLYTRYSKFNRIATNNLETELIKSTKHWLSDYPDSLSLYKQAISKYSSKVFERNLMDDLRLSLELLLKKVLKNDKSIENQLGIIGNFVQANGGSKEYVNMFVKLIEYYSKYQNTYIKHDDNVNTEEIEFVVELTSCFMRHIVRIAVTNG